MVSIEADCNLAIEDPVNDDDDDGDQDGGIGFGLDGVTSSAPVASSEESAKSWGLDRIDARAGTDGKYKYGTATGKATRVYVLDTGIRISHEDFEGRAVPGFSYGCKKGARARNPKEGLTRTAHARLSVHRAPSAHCGVCAALMLQARSTPAAAALCTRE